MSTIRIGDRFKNIEPEFATLNATQDNDVDFADEETTVPPGCVWVVGRITPHCVDLVCTEIPGLAGYGVVICPDSSTLAQEFEPVVEARA